MAQAARLSLRMQKELKLLLTDPPHGVSLLPLSDSESSSISSLSDIEARIEGPEGTVYADGVFTVRIQIPERYPFQPPNVTFVTPIYHPNIDNGGRICLDILNLPPKGAWQPSLNISTVLTSIGLLLSDPNPDDGLMCETSKEYKYNRQVFDQKARSWTERFAKAGICGSSNDSCIQPKPKKIERETGFEDPSIGNEGSRKIRVIGEKLSLKSVPVEEKSAGEKKENVKSARRLSLSLSLNVLGGSEKANTLKHEILSAEVHPRQDHCIENKENISLAPSRHLSLCQSQNVLGHMNETSTLKHKTVSSKPHLMQDDCIENKENKSLAPAKHLLPSQSQNVLGVSNKAPNLKHEISVESRLKQDDCIEISNRNEQQLEQGFNVVNTVIVLDSESDDEDDRPARSRFSLLQKRMTGNLKNGSAAKCKSQI